MMAGDGGIGVDLCLHHRRVCGYYSQHVKQMMFTVHNSNAMVDRGMW